jgi:hypothetical protein
VHQYLTIESYKLLKLHLGYDIQAINNNLGGTTSFYVGDKPWQRGFITTGAWREDTEDVVYGYSKSNPPTLTGPSGVIYDIIAIICNLFVFEELKGNSKTMFTDNPDTTNYINKRILTPYDLDKGWWIGLKSGVQTSGGPISERWTVLGLAEYRFASTVSIPIERHIWRWRRIIYDGIQYNTYFSTLQSLGVGLKFRIYINKVNFYLQGSFGTGIGPNPINLWYATGFEYLLNDKFGIVIDSRRNFYPEFNYFITIGVNYLLIKR